MRPKRIGIISRNDKGTTQNKNSKMSSTKHCDLCNKDIAKSHWSRHIKIKAHIGDTSNSPTVHHCNICNLDFRDANSIYQHRQTQTHSLKQALKVLMDKEAEKEKVEDPVKSSPKRTEPVVEKKEDIKQEMTRFTRKEMIEICKGHLPEGIIAGDNSRIGVQLTDEIYRSMRQFPQVSDNDPAFIEVMFKYKPKGKNAIYTLFAEYRQDTKWSWLEFD